MCDPVTLTILAISASAASAGVSIIGQQQQANAAKANATFQANQAEADAKAAQGDATVEAERIRRAGKKQQGAAIAAAAASGVDVSSTSAVRIDQEIGTNAEHDAYMTILDGNNHAARLRQGGQAALIAGQTAGQAARIGQLGSVLNFASTANTAWKKAK